MDSLTQIALGASVAAAVGGRTFGRKTLVAGALLATLPDLDVLLSYPDAIANYTYHRGFSHSLFVLSAFAFVLSWLCLRLKPEYRLHKVRLTLLIWLTLITHPLLDAFTTYGTQLFWPLTLPPVSWASIFIIDPLYTLPLLVAGIGLWFSRANLKWQRINYFCLTVSCCYLLFTQLGKQEVLKQAAQNPATNSAQLFISPTPFNTIAWRLLQYDGEHYYEGFTTLFNNQPIEWRQFATGRELIDDYQSPSLDRLEWFSHGLLKFELQDKQLLATDLRLGMADFYPFIFGLAKYKGQDLQPIESIKIESEGLRSQGIIDLYHQLVARRETLN